MTILGLLAIAAVVAIMFWNIEARPSRPLAEVTIPKRSFVSLGNRGGLVTFSMESGQVLLLTIYLQRVLESTALATGLAFGVLGAGAFTAASWRYGSSTSSLPRTHWSLAMSSRACPRSASCYLA